MKIVSRIGAVLIALIGMVLVAPSPAKAASLGCYYIGGGSGGGDQPPYMLLCQSWNIIYSPNGGFGLSSRVATEGFTRAPKCRVYMRADLTDRASVWSSNLTERSCDYALVSSGDFADNYHGAVYTGAARFRPVACVKLFASASATTAFWTGCHTNDDWIDLP